MPQWMHSTPIAVVLVVLFFLALSRGQFTYWLARLVTSRTVKLGDRRGRLARFARWLDGPQVARGRRFVEKWGLPAISIVYLTVGFQSLVMAASGLLRIGWVRFTLAQVPGCIAWALIYGTVGFAAWNAAAAAIVSGHPLVLVLLALALAAAVVFVVRRVRAHSGEPAEDAPAAEMVMLDR